MVTQIYKKLNWEQDKWENVDKYKWVQIHFPLPLELKKILKEPISIRLYCWIYYIHKWDVQENNSTKEGIKM